MVGYKINSEWGFPEHAGFDSMARQRQLPPSACFGALILCPGFSGFRVIRCAFAKAPSPAGKGKLSVKARTPIRERRPTAFEVGGVRN
jgi:hypothetical protein